MKIGTLADWFGVGLLEGIRESERCGATGVQVYADNKLNPDRITSDQLRILKRTLADCHQEVTALCGELGGFGLEIAAENPAKIVYLKKVIDLACELDSRVITTHIGVVPASSDDPTYAIMKEAMQEIGAYAAERGAFIAVETGPENMDRLSAFIDDCGKGCAINFDPANLHMVSGVDPVSEVAIAGSRIVHTHAKDGVCLKPADAGEYYHGFAVGGLEWASRHTNHKETPLGEGGIDWDQYLTALHKTGYDGYLTIEREVKNGADDIRMAVGFLRQKLEKLGF